MPRGTARVVIFLLALLTAGFAVPSATGVSGEIRVRYVLATWGPMPFTHADAERVARETDAFFQASSSSRLLMPGSVVGPVLLPRTVFDSCNATTIRSEVPASTLAGYSRVALVTPHVQACRFAGEARPTEVLLNGQLHAALAIHELGHTLELDHANSWHCIALGCTVDEYGNPFSVMGEGSGDFNAYEKAKLEWLNGPLHARGNASYEIGPIEGPTTLPQALIVTTAASEFWFESRGRPTPSFRGDSEQPPGVAVIAGPAAGSQLSPYPDGNILLPNPSGGARFAYTAGESFVQRDVFTVVVERHAPEGATLRLEWLDQGRPEPPAPARSCNRAWARRGLVGPSPGARKRRRDLHRARGRSGCSRRRREACTGRLERDAPPFPQHSPCRRVCDGSRRKPGQHDDGRSARQIARPSTHRGRTSRGRRRHRRRSRAIAAVSSPRPACCGKTPASCAFPSPERLA